MSDSLTKERDLGIEALRILAMFMICTLHVLLQGGVLAAAPLGSAQYRVSWFLESVAYCGVNCYALISGYVGVKARFKWSRLALVWLQVLFYELLLSLYFQIVIPSVMAPSLWLNAVTPIISGEYWYITAYAGMFLFIPVMNIALEKLSRRQVRQCLAAGLILFVFLQVLKQSLDLGLLSGYSTIWLCFLYLLGGYIRLYAAPLSAKKIWLLPLFAVCALLTWVSKLWGRGLLLNYTSPTVLAAAVALLLYFTNTDIKGNAARWLISFVSPTTLAVYLIQTNRLVFGIYMKDRFVGLTAYNAGTMLVYVILSALLIFTACSLIDRVRIWLFSLLRLNKAAQKLDAVLADK